MKTALTILLTIFSLVGGLALSGVSIMVTSGFLHENWWESVPALGFWPAIALGGILTVINSGDHLINVGETAKLPARITYLAFALLAYPFLMPFLVGWLNDGVFTSMPDISYGTTLLFTLLSLMFGVAGAFFTWVVKAANESISDS